MGTINIKWLLSLSILTFVLSTILSSNFSGVSDGLTRLGFPIAFMQDTGGKCKDCSVAKWFRFGSLIMDIAFAVGLSLGILSLYKKLR
ncbi:hypothetical protein [Mucilaginibacter sp. HD30]